MSSSSLFSCKINHQKPFHIYNSKKFTKQPFLIIHTDSETHLPNALSNGFSMDEETYNPEVCRKTFAASNAILPIIQNPINPYPTQVKQIPDPNYLQNFTLQLSLLKQQNQNKYFINYNGNGNSTSNIINDSNYGFNQYPGNFMFQEKEKLLSNLALPDSVVRKMSCSAINTKFLDKSSKNYKNISKSPDLRKEYFRKNSKKDGNLSMDDNKSIDGFLSDDEERKENKPIFDLKHLPSPSSGKIINYDELKIYNEDDECLELDEEDEKKSYVSKDFQV